MGRSGIRTGSWLVWAAGCLALACSAQLVDGQEGSSNSAAQGGEDELVYSSDPARRLTFPEYLQTLRRLLGEQVYQAADVEASGLPLDTGKHPFSRMELEITGQHVEAYFAVADQLVDVWLAHPEWQDESVACVLSADSATCLEEWLSAFGRLALRRPLDSEELELLRARFEDGAEQNPGEGVREVVTTLLNLPAFLYRLEIRGTEEAQLLADGKTQSFPLTEEELATRLSFTVTGGPPDEELLDAAEQGELASDKGLDHQIDRLLEQDAARRQMEDFFAEWLGYVALPRPQHPDDFLGDLEREGLSEAMKDELDEYVSHHIFDREANYDLLHESRWARPGSLLQSIYGVDQPDEQELSGDRAGILTRAGLLLDTKTTTNPVRRGIRLLRKVLCVELEVPPAGETTEPIEPPDFDPSKSARERWTEKTSGPSCSGCHSVINPYGFAFEGYDTLGRVRQEEAIFHPETGEIVGSLQVDTETEIALDGASVQVAGGSELGKALAQSDAALECFLENWFSFARGRAPVSGDQDIVSAMKRAEGQSDGSLLEAFRSLLQSEAFRNHHLVESEGP